MVKCQRCGEKINDQKDLVVAPKGVRISPFHLECHTKSFNGFNNLLFGDNPLNSLASTLMAVLSLIFAVIVFFRDFEEFGYILIFLLLLFPAARIYSWAKIERNLS